MPAGFVSTGSEFDQLTEDGSFDYLEELSDDVDVRKVFMYATALVLTDSKTEAGHAERLLRIWLAEVRTKTEQRPGPA